jgi:hypothetical protein
MSGNWSYRFCATVACLCLTGIIHTPSRADEHHAYSGGTGTAEDPYQIATAADLIALNEMPEDYDKHFVLVEDIDLAPNLPGGRVFDGAVIAPDADVAERGFQGMHFAGVLDGNGHTISHLTITGDSYVGLFGKLGPAGIVSNLVMEAVELGATVGAVGGLVGYNEGCVVTSRSSGSVSGNSGAGGLVGHNSGSILASHSSAAASGSGYIGGLVGFNDAYVAASYSSGPVSGGAAVGGLVGQNRRGTITMSYSTGLVSGDSAIGGLVGAGDSFHVTACFWDIESSGRISSAAGTGLTTARMRDMETFLEAGWDFADEVFNGTCDYWQMPAEGPPRLHTRPLMPEGLGTAEQPYLVHDARDLGTVWLAPRAHYRLAQSVDLSQSAWSMAVVPWFGATFDGNGCLIDHLRIYGGSDLGLFGRVSCTAGISHLGLEAVEISGTGYCIGGLVGQSKGSIAASRTSGLVRGEHAVGGLVGRNEGTVSTGCSTAEVTGIAGVGGLVGQNEGCIDTSHSSGPVDGMESVGGLVGYSSGSIVASSSAGSIMGSGVSYEGEPAGPIVGGMTAIGGLVGHNSGSIATSCSSGAVIGDREVGGLVGSNYGSINASYSTGPVSGTLWQVGGLVGDGGGPSSVNSSFWDIETSGQTTSRGGTGKSTAEMQTATTFLEAGWDFADETDNGTEDIWCMDEGRGYPRLWWQTQDGSCTTGD